MNKRSPARILVADDEPLYLETTGALLRKAGYECVCVPDAASAIEALSKGDFDLVLSDLNMPGNLKLELLREQREGWPEIPLIVITGVPSLPTAIESIRLGIADYLLKPVKYDDLLASIRRVLATRAETIAHSEGIQSVAGRASSAVDAGAAAAALFPELVGNSPKMLELREIIERVAGVDVNILLTGESGTGKEVVAQTMHGRSSRAGHRFQVIDCTAIPESLFESMLFGHVKGSFTGAVADQAGLLRQAHRGTAFFDEIGELPLPLQAKLLRVIQEQSFTPVGSHVPVQINTRFICATNRDLELEVHAGRFRRDLYYRLGVIHIPLPALRERGDDIILLADHFVRSLQGREPRVTGFSADARTCLLRHSWPGNVRELRNVVERGLALARGDVIEVSDLPETLQLRSPLGVPRGTGNSPTASLPAGTSRDQVLDETEFEYLSSLLVQHGGNVSRAAKQAGMSRQGLHKLLRKHGIAPADFRE